MRQASAADINSTVFVVDDDEAMRDSIETLMRSANRPVRAFASAADYLEHATPEHRGCVVADVRMPGMNGLDLHAAMQDAGLALPVIFITGHGNIAMAVRAMREGAYDFVEKPFDDDVLLDRVDRAVQTDRDRFPRDTWERRVLSCYATLTAREREIFALIADGMLNKQIAADFDISQRTVETHRMRVMEKMQAESLAALVRMHLVVETQASGDDDATDDQA